MYTTWSDHICTLPAPHGSPAVRLSSKLISSHSFYLHLLSPNLKLLKCTWCEAIFCNMVNLPEVHTTEENELSLLY